MGKVALAVCAHPDDLEFFCGGSAAGMVRDGWDVWLTIATDGDRGTHDAAVSRESLAVVRREESRRAGQVLGLSGIVFLGKEDGELYADHSLRRDLARVYRQTRPDRLITFDPWRRYELHPDHRAIGFASLDARLAARLPHYYSDLLRDGLEPCTIKEILLFNTDAPDYYVDISSTFDAKLSALGQHRSQWESIWDDTARSVRQEAESAGRMSGYAMAEAFKRMFVPMGPVSADWHLKEEGS
ncbi:MAG TPA: PIG-L family deacetylase [Bacillota bacterium]|nr:PIG-L family deacetylase [Bacillota bacterium]HNU93351.1 PIG-L family deacetylase [Bacillota bacterium]HNY67747.1 PIG-L family deacetylase [Bacillota bacterium]HOI36917.1 PIG-L family deacetylase [Bacillota bacterium]